MNTQDRKRAAQLVEQVEALRSQLETVTEELRTLAEAEHGKFDNMTEGLQASERGQKIEAAADALDNAVSELENFDFESVVTYVNEACQ